MTIFVIVLDCLRSSFVWKGRANRAEFWWFFVFVWLVSIVLTASLDETFSYVFDIAMMPAYFAAAARRLHDRDWSGKWVAAWIVLIVASVASGFTLATTSTPGDLATVGASGAVWAVLGVIGATSVLSIVLLVVCALRGDAGANRYGPPPRSPGE